MGIRHVAPLLLASTLLLAGCATATNTDSAVVSEGSGTQESASSGAAAAATQLLESFGITADASDPESLIESLDAIPVADRPADLVTSITGTEVMLQSAEQESVSVALDTDKFYLSLAPYREQTHDCSFHSPTGCIGELSDTEVDLTVTDVATGEVVVEKQARTADNGFVGLWLPRDGEFEIEVQNGGDSGTETVRTGDEDPTCITTLQVA